MGALSSKARQQDAPPIENKWERTLREEEVIQAAAMPLGEVPSCMNLFDTWAMCFALVPQLRNVYRYGGMNQCKSKLEDFKHCLSLKGLTAEEFREKWIERRAEASASKRLERSSEDVWEIRREPIVDPEFAETSNASSQNAKQR